MGGCIIASGDGRPYVVLYTGVCLYVCLRTWCMHEHTHYCPFEVHVHLKLAVKMADRNAYTED